jgi:hypothetical protein
MYRMICGQIAEILMLKLTMYVGTTRFYSSVGQPFILEVSFKDLRSLRGEQTDF